MYTAITLLGPRRVRYLILMVGTLLVAFLYLFFRSYQAVDRNLTSAAMAQRAALSYLAAATLREKFHQVTDIGISLATRVHFQRLVAAGEWAQAMDILRKVPRDFPYIERMFLTDIHGTEEADFPPLPGVLGHNFAYRQWYKKIRVNWTPGISPIYRRAAVPRHAVIAASIPIRDSKGAAVGILVLQIQPSAFFTWTKKLDIGQQGVIYVVDSQGRAAFYPGIDVATSIRDFSKNDVVRRLVHGRKGIQSADDPVAGIEELAAYAPASQGWGVVVEQPLAVAFSTRDGELRRILLGAGSLLVLAIAILYLAAQLYLQRIKAEAIEHNTLLLEKMVDERTAELEETNKELASFSYSVAHDLRAPLRAIDGFAHVIEEDYGKNLDDEGRRLLGIVRSRTARMGQLIDDLLAFSRLGRTPINAGLVNVGQLVAEVLAELVDPASDTDVAVGAMPDVFADRALLRQVWTNLIANALKYSSSTPMARVEIGAKDAPEEVVYWVKDNGVGFDMRYVDKLFGVFQRLHTEAEFAGTGLGLAIVRRIVTRHGGQVWAESKVNQGASFYFSLPKRRERGEGYH